MIQESPSGDPPAIPDALRDALAPCARWVREGRTYGIRCDGAAWLDVGRERLTPVWPGRFSWTARNAVGRARVRGGATGLRESPPLDVEVVARRFDGPAAQLRFVRATVAALEREQSVDPFRDRHLAWRASHDEAATSSTALREALVEQGLAIAEALAAVRARPARTLTERDARLSVSADTPEISLAELAHASGPWERCAQDARGSTFVRLRGRAPREAWGRRAEHADDSLENRWLRRRLAALSDRADEPDFIASLASLPPRDRARVGAALDALREALASAPLRDAIGPLAEPSRARARCLRKPHYADAVQWIERAERRPTLRWPAAHQAVSLRDASALYEMFCFFALARGIAAALGQPVTFHGPEADERVGSRARGGLARGAVARLGPRHTLVYNADVMAYSGALRPDFVLREDGVISLVLDAKMRVREPAAAPDRAHDEGERAARLDIDRMHAYRDALGARAAVCVFPGDRSALFRTDGTRSDALRLAGLVRGGAHGVGALALVPEGAL
jgi:hypothetical protein